MTPEQYIGHGNFRVFMSRLWPVTAYPCFASWNQHKSGEIVFYSRGRIPRRTTGYVLDDEVAREIYGSGEACHRCFHEFSFGKYTTEGEYVVRYGTTNKSGRENPWGKLCRHCRKELAQKATEEWLARIEHLEYSVESDLVQSLVKDH